MSLKYDRSCDFSSWRKSVLLYVLYSVKDKREKKGDVREAWREGEEITPRSKREEK